MSSDKHSYTALFILDNRGREDSVDGLIDEVRNEISAVDGEVVDVENLGRQEFARPGKKRLNAGIYLRVTFKAPPDATARMHERLRLNNAVYRVLVQAA